jgi:hypothetical protein
MTSLLLKKRRTTRRSMLAGNEPFGYRGVVLAMFVTACWFSNLQAAPWHELFGGMPAAGFAEKKPDSEAAAGRRNPRALDISAVLGVDTSGRAGSRVSQADSEFISVTRAGPSIDAPTGTVTPTAAETSDVSEEDAAFCAADAEACRLALEQLRLDRISEIDLDIRVEGVAGNDYPCECRLDGEVFEPRRFATTTFTWKAAGYCHKPLYFEQWNFERYGHSYGWAADPFISAAHFFGTLPILPYKMGVELPWECVYPVGYYRPGNCAPWTVPAFPISGRGLAVEAATVTGLVFLLP